jgi:MarR family transcriptional regulator, lower aerobic nicotinate degradation pathway regulator
LLPVRSGSRIILSRCADVANEPRKKAPTFIVENQVGFLVRAVSQRNHLVFTRLMGAGLTRVQFAVLAKLLEIGSCSQNELGRLTLLDRASIKGVVSRLKKRGYVQVQKDNLDRRQYLVGLTKLGQKSVKRGVAIAPRITEEMLRGLTGEERRSIVDLLKKIVE